MITRSAEAVWQGSLQEGTGTVSVESGAFTEQPYSFRTRFGDGQGGTNPEELIGAAHAGCYSMALSNMLAQAGHPPERVHTAARVHMEKGEGGFSITRIDLTTEADVPGISGDDFQRLAQEAKAGCPVSQALSVEITLDATLSNG